MKHLTDYIMIMESQNGKANKLAKYIFDIINNSDKRNEKLIDYKKDKLPKDILDDYHKICNNSSVKNKDKYTDDYFSKNTIKLEIY